VYLKRNVQLASKCYTRSTAKWLGTAT